MSNSGIVSSLAQKLRTGDPVYLAWCCLGSPKVAESMLREGYDAALLDMQHGPFDFASTVRGVELALLAGKPAMARIPVGDFAMASKLLDFGCAGIIAPMINSVADAQAFAKAMKYPPLGERSWGPSRTMALDGREDGMAYLQQANSDTLAIAMIETRAALEAIDDILAVPGIDGVLLGPADLSIALTNGGLINAEGDVVNAELDRIAGAARRAGKIASAFCGSGARAHALVARGFQLVSAGLDFSVLRIGAQAELKTAREGGAAKGPGGY